MQMTATASPAAAAGFLIFPLVRIMFAHQKQVAGTEMSARTRNIRRHQATPLIPAGLSTAA